MERNSTDGCKLKLDTQFPVVEYFSLLSLISLDYWQSIVF